jgi:DNA repair protein RadA/Sms
VDRTRLAQVLAVLSRHAGVRVGDQDVFVSVAGGARAQDPAADLAIALAVASAARGTPLPGTTAAMGEIGLTGAVRPVGHAGRRLAVCAAHQVGRVVSGPVGDATATAGAHLLLRNEVPDAIRAAFAGNGA